MIFFHKVLSLFLKIVVLLFLLTNNKFIISTMKTRYTRRTSTCAYDLFNFFTSRKLLILTFLSIISLTLPAQQQQSGFVPHLSESQRCNTVEADQELRAIYPEIGTFDQFNDWLVRKTEELEAQVGSGSRSLLTCTLPIVFHVIHDGDAVGSGANLSAALINAQIEQINNDFRKILGTSGDNNNPVGADTEIEFCAALTDPNGAIMPEPGINRIDRNAAGWTAPPYIVCCGPNCTDKTYVQETIKPESQWDPTQYVNVWVMPLDCGLLGYAQFPDMSGLGGLNPVAE